MLNEFTITCEDKTITCEDKTINISFYYLFHEWIIIIYLCFFLCVSSLLNYIVFLNVLIYTIYTAIKIIYNYIEYSKFESIIKKILNETNNYY